MFGKIARYRFKRSALIGVAALAILGGVAAATRWRLGNDAMLLLLMPLVLASWRRQNLAAFLGIAMLCFGLGLWRGGMYTAALQRYGPLFQHHVEIVGVAVEDGAYGSREQLSFDLTNVKVVEAGVWRPLIGTINVSGFGGGVVHRGDVVQASGVLQPTIGGNQARISFAELHTLPRPPNTLERLRRRFVAGLQSALPEPLASFGLGLLVGQRNTLPSDVTQTLLAVGLTHIIAVSGYNLTILLRAVRRMLGGRSKFQTLSVSILLMFAFLLVAGSSPSLERAALVSGLSLAAWYYGRAIKPLPLLLVAAATSALLNPLYLRGNVSWCLSFLAFFGVMIVAPLLTRRLFGAREPPLLIAVAVESICAEILTLPYVLHEFGQLSLVGLFANVLVVALVPLAMLLVLIAGLAGMVAAAFAGWFAWPARWLLMYMLNAATLLSRIPHVFVQRRSFSVAAMLGSYAILGVVAFVLWHSVSRNAIITEKKIGTKGVAGHERTFQMVYD